MPTMWSRSSNIITDGCLHPASRKASSSFFRIFSNLFPKIQYMMISKTQNESDVAKIQYMMMSKRQSESDDQ